LKKKIPLSTKIFVAMIAGYFFGIFAGAPVVPFLKPIGDIFIRLIFMVVAPLIFFSITAGVASMEDIKKTGRIGGKVAGLYLITSTLAAFIGVAAALILRPGIGFVMKTDAKPSDRVIPSIVDSIVAMAPKNIFDALVNMNMVQVIVFSIFLGVSLVLLGEAGKPITKAFQGFADAMIKMTSLVMELTPYGVFALMAVTGANYGFAVMLPLGKFFLTEYTAIIFQFLITYSLIVYFIAKANPFKFLRKVLPVIAMTLSTTSSSATLPVTMRVAEEEMGVPKNIAGFALPLGATVNQDGAALNIPIAVLFTAQIFGLSLSPGDFIIIIFSAIVMSIGAAGVPGGAIVFILILLEQFGLPTEAFALVIAVYRVIDMGLTTINVVGDVACTTAVAQSEGVLDRTKWGEAQSEASI
jgi:Na+/H+-dicarboxylate symporter